MNGLTKKKNQNNRFKPYLILLAALILLNCCESKDSLTGQYVGLYKDQLIDLDFDINVAYNYTTRKYQEFNFYRSDRSGVSILYNSDLIKLTTNEDSLILVNDKDSSLFHLKKIFNVQVNSDYYLENRLRDSFWNTKILDDSSVFQFDFISDDEYLFIHRDRNKLITSCSKHRYAIFNHDSTYILKTKDMLPYPNYFFLKDFDSVSISFLIIGHSNGVLSPETFIEVPKNNIAKIGNSLLGSYSLADENLKNTYPTIISIGSDVSQYDIVTKKKDMVYIGEWKLGGNGDVILLLSDSFLKDDFMIIRELKDGLIGLVLDDELVYYKKTSPSSSVKSKGRTSKYK